MNDKMQKGLFEWEPKKEKAKGGVERVIERERTPSAETTATASAGSEPAVAGTPDAVKALIATSDASVEQLAAAVRFHNARYNDGKPVISDALYDALIEKLREVDPSNAVLDELTTPAVQTPLHGKKVTHDVAMLSLEKLKKGEEFKSIALWLNGFRGDFIGSPKIDGLACSLVYDENGSLVVASTRGDGHVGENITENVYYIDDIPKKIAMGNVEVRGEVYMPLTAFRAYDGEKISARNLAVGGLKQKDARQTSKYGLSFFAYEALGQSFETDTEKFEKLRLLGFHTVETRRFAWNERRSVDDVLNEVRAYCDEMANARSKWDFDADGLVFKVDDNKMQQSMGTTAHHPKCAIAYKFACDSAKTTLRDVLWQVAKGGTLTPVAVFDAVELAGANVQRATLSNVEQVESFPVCPSDLADSPELPATADVNWSLAHLSIGDTLCVSRRGDVIPHVEYIVSSAPSAQKVGIPTQCTSCGAPLLRDGKFLRCTDPDNCPTTGQALIENYVKVTGMMGLGEKIIASLYDENLITLPSDLYRLTPEQIASAVQNGDDSIDASARLPQKLYQSIQSHRNLSLATFLEALSIPALGKVYSSLLAQSHLSIDEILQLDAQKITDILKGRELTANKIHLALQKKRSLIQALLEFVTIDDEVSVPQNEGGPLAGMSFLFTGTLKSMKRDEAQKRVEALGATVASGVSKNLSVLVSTTNKTSKWTKAEKLNEQGAKIALWTEEEFLEKLKELS